SLSGSVLNTPDPKIALRPSTCSNVSAKPPVKSPFKAGSCDAPKKANGAIRAPELVPLMIENSGRFPASVQPTNKPAPNAPSAPPPDNARTSMDVGLCCPSLKGAVRASAVGSSAQMRASEMPGILATSEVFGTHRGEAGAAPSDERRDALAYRARRAACAARLVARFNQFERI